MYRRNTMISGGLFLVYSILSLITLCIVCISEKDAFFMNDLVYNSVEWLFYKVIEDQGVLKFFSFVVYSIIYLSLLIISASIIGRARFDLDKFHASIASQIVFISIFIICLCSVFIKTCLTGYRFYILAILILGIAITLAIIDVVKSFKYSINKAKS